jgi:hypothetical protein
MPVADFLRASEEHSVTGLVYERVRALVDGGGWPGEMKDALAHEVRAQTVAEMLRHRELRIVADALATAGIPPIFIKGTALAYSVYENPSSRPRVDTDLLIGSEQVRQVRDVMARLGYTAPPYCEGELLFGQFPLVRATSLGVNHRFDFHWKISTQSVFADVLRYDEMAGRTVALPALGVHARALAPLDALLLACIHPAMHHRNIESLLWTYDVHLLASSLSDGELERFAELAVERRVAAICASQLRTAQRRFATPVPSNVIEKLTAVGDAERSAVYLRANRRWIGELASNVRGLERWSDRLRLLREVTFPDAAYMLKVYGCDESFLGVALLPALYGHRLMAGVWKVVTGRK